MRTFDLSKPIWLEDESRNVGKVLVPPGIFSKMEHSKRFIIFSKMEHSKRFIVEVPIEVRAEHLAKDYTGYGNQTIIDSLTILKKRLSERFPAIVEHINAREYKEAAILILPYYDKSYTKGLQRRDPKLSTIIALNSDDPVGSALKIKEMTE
ncbi:MAG: hypothetical protein B6229_08815 [Spirochaetaceae bacterium 4572_7]|nr:MAG: hypothetical protein B6229_08815 [Spirochaetaceae bacterium 4572_7]